MMNLKKLALFLVVVMVAGCATVPLGPSVEVLPTPGKSFDTFRTEDMTCRDWAQQQLGKPVQETYNKNVATGAIGGTAVGAGLGAAVGSASGHAGTGAAIGAATGLLAGTAIGSSSGQISAAEAQHRYDNAYTQCMYTYGNQVSGYNQAATPAPLFDAAPAAEPYPLPEFYFEQAPQFIFSPELDMYVAVGVPYDLVYTGTDYYCFYQGHWFRGPYFNGPWVYVPRRHYPQVFLRFGIGDFRHFRDEEFGRYEHDREHYRGRFHRPEFRGKRRGREHKDEHR
ncbi:MAG: YMGG-like glycine zipper-containing protein [Desulfuromonadaceae bacterium]|nr:YMGG-like glycine zipper-containing protein [Desulfuromonadaceae bacterium]